MVTPWGGKVVVTTWMLQRSFRKDARLQGVSSPVIRVTGRLGNAWSLLSRSENWTQKHRKLCMSELERNTQTAVPKLFWTESKLPLGVSRNVLCSTNYWSLSLSCSLSLALMLTLTLSIFSCSHPLAPSHQMSKNIGQEKKWSQILFWGPSSCTLFSV